MGVVIGLIAHPDPGMSVLHFGMGDDGLNEGLLAALYASAVPRSLILNLGAGRGKKGLMTLL